MEVFTLISGMKYRCLSNSGLSVSILEYGKWVNKCNEVITRKTI